MDDERIQKLTEEVLAAVRRAPVEPEAVASIEGRANFCAEDSVFVGFSFGLEARMEIR